MSKNRNRAELVCVNCPKGCRVEITSKEGKILDITGYECPLGEDYALEEFKNPTRILPTTVRVNNGKLPLVSVKSRKPIPKSKIGQAMNELAETEVEAPVYLGDVVKSDIAGTGVDMVATRTIYRNNDNTKLERENRSSIIRKVCC